MATPDDKNYGLTDLGYLILMDRYAYKTRGNVNVGDLVIAIVNNDSSDMGQKRELATVTKVDGDLVTVKMRTSGDETVMHINLLDKPMETTPREIQQRVARGISSVETAPEKQIEWQKNFEWLLDDWKFVPGGRILAAAGTDQKLTNFNCVSAETLIHTEEGLIPAKNLAGKTVKVLSEGGVYRDSIWNSYGVQQLWEIVLKNGDTLYATKGHEWITTSDSGDKVVTTDRLEEKRIPMQPAASIYVDHNDPEFICGVRHGYVYGDGTIQPQKYKGELKKTVSYVPAFTDHNKRFVTKWFEKTSYQPSRNAVVANTLPSEWKDLPSIDKSTIYLRGFIAGLIAADGHVDNRGSVMLHQSDFSELVAIRKIASKCELPVASIKMTREVNPFSGEYAPNYKMQFVKLGFTNSNLILLDTHKANLDSSPKSKKRPTIKVISVRPTQRNEEVFCCVEPETHTMVIEGGYLTKQCFVLPSISDSRHGIFERLEQMAEIMSRGGGVGINISTLRPKNAPVAGVNGRSSGSVSWGALFSYVTGLIEQAGSRRGALMVILNDWHPDIFRFIESKKKAGNITNANISVGISDEFMQRVKNDDMWYLKFPDTKHPTYDSEWDGNIERWESKGYPVVVYNEIPARQLWEQIVVGAWASAEPGLWFRDRANWLSNSYYYDDLIATNPCVTGDTRLHTQYGLVKAIDLYRDDLPLNVTVDNRVYGKGKGVSIHPAVPMFKTSDSADVYEVVTKHGYKIKATDWHKLYTNNGKKALKDINVGEKLMIQSGEGQFGTFDNVDAGLVMGLITGDGWFNASSDSAHIGLWNELSEHRNEIAEAVYRLVDGEEKPNRSYTISPTKVADSQYRIGSQRLQRVLAKYDFRADTKHKVPEVIWQGNKETVVAYLRGLFETDGTVNISGKKNCGSVRLAQSNREFLEEIQMLLSNFGIFAPLHLRRKEADKKLPDGKGGSKLYHTKEQYEIVIGGESARVFMREIGFMTEAKKEKWNSWAADKQFRKTQKFETEIVSINYIGKRPVYDTTQPNGNAVIFNGIVSGQCGEQPLPGFGICNLGALNLSQFVANKQIDENKLRQAVRYGVRFLDNVIDDNYYFMEANKQQQMKERRVGLGIMGLAEMMILCEVRYGSEESIRFTDRLFRIMSEEAYLASSEIASEKGSFSAFDTEKYLASQYMLNMPESVISAVRRNGSRNVTLLTCAPTGSIGTMLNTSTGIEPFFSWVFYRKGRLGMHEERIPLAQNWIEQNGSEQLPEYFVTAMELSPFEHVTVMAAAQRWVDSSISKTVNCPNDWTIEQVGELYMQMYDLGCKGGTIYRDGSRSEQVLTTKPAVSESKPENKIIISEPKPVDRFIKIDKRDVTLRGKTLKGQTPYGSVFITINEDGSGAPFEVFITIAKSGSDLAAQGEALGRLISTMLQMQTAEKRVTALQMVVQQLRGIGGSRPSGFGANRVASFPDAVAKLLEESLNDESTGIVAGVNDTVEVARLESKAVGIVHIPMANTCPECHNNSLLRQDGCEKCGICGYSVC